MAKQIKELESDGGESRTGGQRKNTVVREDPCEEGSWADPGKKGGTDPTPLGENMFQALEPKGTEALNWQYVWFV